MAGGILLMILFILAVLLLLPIRVRGAYGDGAWFVTVYYALIRVFHKASAPKPPPPQTPPKPEDYDPEHPENLFYIPEKPEHEAPENEEPEKPEQPEAKPESVHPEPVISQKPEQTAPENTQQPEQTVPVSDAEADGEIPEAVPYPAEKPGKKKRRRKKDSAAAEESPEQTEEQPKKKKRGFIARIKPQSVPEWIALGRDALASLFPALRFLGKHLHFRHVKLYLSVASDDPAKTAQNYGRICAAFFPLQGQLESIFDIQADELRILSDFSGSKTDFRAALELRVSPAALLLLVLILGVRFLWRVICRFRREDREEKRRVREQTPLPAE